MYLNLDGRISQFHFLSILRNSNNLEFQIFSVTRFFWRQTLTLEYYKEPIFNFLNRSEQHISQQTKVIGTKMKWQKKSFVTEFFF